MGFGEQLRKTREERKITRAELAEMLGVAPSAIGNYETSRSFPREEVLLRLFDALQISPNDLFCDSFRPSPFFLSEAERSLVARWRELPITGRQAVYALVDALGTMQQELLSLTPERAERQIPLYCSPAAAGYVSPVMGEDFDYITVTPDVPAGAEFAVRIRGDSMEPLIPDGSIAYVSREALQGGDVGIFCVDGDILCKQYYRDALGITYLFSLNRARADADVVLTRESGRALTCFGRVLLRRRPDLPQLMG